MAAGYGKLSIRINLHRPVRVLCKPNAPLSLDERVNRKASRHRWSPIQFYLRDSWKRDHIQRQPRICPRKGARSFTFNLVLMVYVEPEPFTNPPFFFATMSSTPSVVPTGFESPMRIAGATPPWARYSTFLDDQGELQFSPPRGSRALKKALDWQFPEEHTYVDRLRRATEIYYENIESLVVSSRELEMPSFDTRQRVSPTISSHSTPISGFSAASEPTKRGKRDTSCKKHYDNHKRVDLLLETHLCA